jgi:hypothetical protein
MGVGSVLSLKVTGQQSHGLVTVIDGVVAFGGPPFHVHEAEDEGRARFPMRWRTWPSKPAAFWPTDQISKLFRPGDSLNLRA